MPAHNRVDITGMGAGAGPETREFAVARLDACSTISPFGGIGAVVGELVAEPAETEDVPPFVVQHLLQLRHEVVRGRKPVETVPDAGRVRLEELAEEKVRRVEKAGHGFRSETPPSWAGRSGNRGGTEACRQPDVLGRRSEFGRRYGIVWPPCAASRA